jgi:hypothetical protein
MENDVSPAPAAPPWRSAGKAFLLVFLLAFLLGGGAIGWLASTGRLAPLIGQGEAPSAPLGAMDRQPEPALSPQAAEAAGQLAAAEARAAALAQRLAALEMQARGAAGTAGHAEDLLVSIAARRQIERGQPLGYLEDELKRRFNAARPEAVQTVLESARRPVTLAGLAARLETLDAKLETGAQASGWSRLRHELAGLFVIRREDTPRATPSQRIDRARLLLGEGQLEKAIAEVSHLPGGSGARDWVESAQRFARTRRALDLIEESALTPPVRQVIAPTPEPTPQPDPEPTNEPAPAPVT